MAKKLAKPGRSGEFRFAEDGVDEPTPILGQKRPAPNEERMSVSLKYYRQETQCFSEWRGPELKKFTLTIAKLREMTPEMARTHAIVGRHRNKINSGRYLRPDGISKDLDMFEIRVDPHNLARIHGVFAGSTFHLIWLDRSHELFPQ